MDGPPTGSSADLDPKAFREALGHYPTGVVVVTGIADDGEPIGLVVGTFSSVSLDPPLVSFMPTKTSFQFERLRTAPVYCVNVLAYDQQELCRLMAAPRAGKFDDAEWHLSSLGAPVLKHALAVIHCKPSQTIEAGDHYVELCSVLDLEVVRSVPPLLFFQGGYGAFALSSRGPDVEYSFISRAQVAYASREHLRSLAPDLGCTAAALVVAGDDVELTTAVVAGSPCSELGASVGDRLPLVPPVGAAYFAWATPDQVEAWLMRAPALAEPARDLLLRSLDAVKARGHSIVRQRTTAGCDVSELYETLRESCAGHLTPARHRALTSILDTFVELIDPSPLAAHELHDIAAIDIPVHDVDGSVRTVLRCSDLPRQATSSEIEQWVARAKAAAAQIERDLVRQHDDEAVRPNAHWYELAYVV